MTDPRMTEQATVPRTSPPRSAPTVFLHIGTPKTGTSFLQSVLKRNAALLEEDGVRYPLDDDRWALQVLAVRDILGARGKPLDGGWPAMVEHIQAWPGRAALVSMEFLSLARPAQVRKIVAGLAPSNVEVIITARDLVRLMPSAWQSMIKQGQPWSFPEFVASITANGEITPNAHRRFWRHHDVAGITSRWVREVGADNVHLVTVPPSGSPPALLWERFCSVIGVDPSRYDISQDKKSNFSLSFSDSELMRQINLALQKDLGRSAHKRWATHYLANRVLRVSSGERFAHDRPALSASTHQWAIERSQQMVEDLSTLGMQVVGDLSELVPPTRNSVDDPPAAPATSYPDSAAHIMAALLRRIAEVDPQLSSQSTEIDGHDPDPDPDDDADAPADADADAGSGEASS